MPRILVIDDDESTRKTIREHLGNAYEVLDIGEPERAVTMTLEHKPDAILLELLMPRISGFEILQALSSLPSTRRIPVLVITGSGERNKAYCLKLGAKGYFEKPLNFEQIGSELNHVLNSRGRDRRMEERFSAGVILKLKGTDKTRSPYEVRTVTENVSENGFLCPSTRPFTINDLFEVYACGRGEEVFIGIGQVVRSETNVEGIVRYGFRFAQKIEGKSLKGQSEIATK